MAINKFHITGMRPCKILQIRDKNTIVFQGEYGYIYEFNSYSHNVLFLSVGSGSIYEEEQRNRKKDIKIESIHTCFCGLMLDYIFINMTELVCCSSEGTIHLLEYTGCKWNVKGEMRITRDRLVSIKAFENQLFLLSHVGDIYWISIPELRSGGTRISLSSIWDLDVDEKYLYVGSADGKLCIYNKNTQDFFCSYHGRSGWINAVHKNYCCTSDGTIYRFDVFKGLSEIYSAKGKYWFNELRIVEDRIIAVTAEGYVLYLDLAGKLISEIRLSINQLISVDSDEDRVYIASIKGEIFSCELVDDTFAVSCIYMLNMNITCIQAKDGNVFVATTEGEICELKIPQCYTSVQMRPVLVNVISLSKSRIWKIVISPNYVYGGSIAGEVFKICMKDFSVEMYQTNQEITSLLVSGNSIIYGTRFGKVGVCSISNRNIMNPTLRKIFILAKKFYSREKNARHCKSIKLHISGPIDFNGRLIRFLKMMNYKFQIIEHEKERIAADIEWWKYPYITFDDKFLASGMLLDEFCKHNVIERLI